MLKNCHQIQLNSLPVASCRKILQVLTVFSVFMPERGFFYMLSLSKYTYHVVVDVGWQSVLF